MVQLYGLSDIGCEQNRQFQAVILVYVSQVKSAYTWWTNQIWRPSVLVLLSSKLSCKLKTWQHQGWFVVLVHLEIHWSIPSSSGTYTVAFRKQVEHSRVDPTQAYERSYTWSGIENGSERCAAETTVTIWEIGASWIKTRIFRSMYSLSKTI